MLGHVVLQLSGPLAFVAAVRTKVLFLFSVDPHMKLEEGTIYGEIAENIGFMLLKNVLRSILLIFFLGFT